MYGRTMVITFIPTVMYHTRKLNPNVATCILTAPMLLQARVKSGGERTSLFMRVPLLPWLGDKVAVVLAVCLIPWWMRVTCVGPKYITYDETQARLWNRHGILTYLWGFPLGKPEECTTSMKTTRGVFCSADDDYAKYRL